MAIHLLDLHGLTLEEATNKVDLVLNRLFIEETNPDRRLRIVTGRGAVLRPRVAEYLTGHPLVKESSVDSDGLRVILEDLI